MPTLRLRLTGLLLLVGFCLAACGGVAPTATPSPQPTLVPTSTPFPTQKLRLTNQSTYTLQKLVVRFPEAQVDFGDLPPAQTTDYHDVPLGVYGYAAYSVDVDGKHYDQPVIDWVGEVPVAGSAFTYVLGVDPAKWTTEGRVVLLNLVTVDQQ